MSPFVADENHSNCDVDLPVESEAKADLSVEEWPEAINEDESAESNDLDLDPNDSSSDEREGISSASQTVCMSGTANVDLLHLSAIDGHFDVGNLTNQYASHQEVNIAIKFGPKPNLKRFPRDNKGKRFPLNIFKQTLQNGDDSVRDWLVWSEARESLFCFPCRLFKSSSTNVGASALCSIAGWSKEKGWRKLYDRVPEHEHRVFHRQHYLEWHTAERRLLIGSGIDTHIEKEIKSEVEKWRDIEENY